jgi:hypothetical protein
MKNFKIGSVHTIWVNPFCDDVNAKVVSYNSAGRPIMRVLDEGTTLEPHEYVLPKHHQQVVLKKMEEMFETVHGEKL